MGQQQINVVWLKRDLRLQDHAPLFHAEQEDIPYLIVYCFEPSLLEYPDTSIRHLRFIYHPILVINAELQPFGKEEVLFHGEALLVFTFLGE